MSFARVLRSRSNAPRHRQPERSRSLRGLVAAVAAVALLLTGVVATVATPDAAQAGATAPAATQPDCSYATPGTGTYASTICWLDMSTFDPAAAATSVGQAMTIALPGGYTMTYTAKFEGGAVEAVALPTWSGSFLGNNSHYTGVSGKTALYQSGNGQTTTVDFSDIEVKDSNGAAVSGYSLVGADAESTDGSTESISWTAGAPLRLLSPLGNSCGGGFTAITPTTTTVTCAGSSAGGTKTGNAILAATNPGTFSQTMVGSGQQAIAFGVLVSTVRLNKTVDSRFSAGDAFGVTVKAADSALGSANTGATGTTASTGLVTVLAGDSGVAVDLSEAATAGTLDHYIPSWACTRQGSGTGALPSGNAGTSAIVTLGVGDFVDCTITNTARTHSLAVTKSSTATAASRPGDTVTYTVTATASGTIDYTTDDPAVIVDDLSGVLDDAKYQGDAFADQPGAVAFTTPRLSWNGALKLGASVVLSYSVVLGAKGDGIVRNVAFAPNDGTTNAPTPVCDSGTGVDSTTGEHCAAISTLLPRLQIVKAADRTELPRAGDVVNYTVTAKNVGPGSFTVANPATVIDDLSKVIDDATFDTDSLSPASARYTEPTVTWSGALASGSTAVLNYAVRYTGAGDHKLVNVAFAPSPGPGGSTPTCDPVDASGNDATTGEACGRVQIPGAALVVAKSVNPASGTAVQPGNTLSYALSFHNTGQSPAAVDRVDDLSGVIDDADVTAQPTASDPSLSVSAISNGSFAITGTVAVGATVTVEYQATVKSFAQQGDHTLRNFLLSSGENPPAGGNCAAGNANCTVNAVSQLALTKSGALASGSDAKVGGTIDYTFTASNTGVATLHDVTVTDSRPGLSTITYGVWPGAPHELAPGESVTATATYVLTQADLDAGAVHNDAITSGNPETGDPVTAAASADVPIPATPAISLVKTAAYAAGATGAAGDTVDYTFTATNTGTVTLHDVAIADQLHGLSAVTYRTWPAANGVLASGQSVTAIAHYVLTQADVDAGAVRNTATTTGTPPTGDPVTGTGSVEISTPSGPAVQVVKNGELTTGATGKAGDTVNYTFTLSNIGNVTLHDAAVADPMSGLSAITYGAWPAAAGVLTPGQFVTATALYVLTQADVDAGSVQNSATASGTPPTGDPVTDTDTVVVTISDSAGIELKKTGALEHDAAGKAGDTVHYTFTATNTGTVTLHTLAIADQMRGLSTVTFGAWPGEAGTLAPGESVTATANYRLNPADVAAGTVHNTATVSAVPPQGDPVTAISSVTVIVPPASAAGLATTGSNVAFAALMAILVLLAGLALIVGRRRFRRSA